MQKDDKITLALPDGSVRTGRIVKIISHPQEPYYVVAFDNGEQYGYFKSEIDKDKSRFRLKAIKLMLGNKFFSYEKRRWACGYVAALQDSKLLKEICPITEEEANHLRDYINGDAE